MCPGGEYHWGQGSGILVYLCSRDTASCDHAFPSGLLATTTTVSKTPRGRCVHRVKRPLLRLFSTPKWYMKTYFDWLYAIIV